MKSEKGITLISIIIYVLGMVLIVSLMATMTSYFYKNVNLNREETNYDREYTKINSFFTEESNVKGNRVLEINNDSTSEQQWIAFSSGNQYTFISDNQSVYKNNVKIASNIKSFSVNTTQSNGKQGFYIDIKYANDRPYRNSYYFNN